MNFDFIGRSKIWAAVSGTVILIAIVALLARGINLSIEFTGGTSMNVKFIERPDISKVRDSISKFGLSKSIIQPVGAKDMLIRFSQVSRKTQNNVQVQLKKDFKIKDIGIEQVGPEWGSQITNSILGNWWNPADWKDNGLILGALFLSLASILIYISLRFEFKMAVSAILALAHDLIITVGVYALVGREMSPATIAALLTITGYSLYDTIVVFHKIIENSKNIQRETYGSMVNRSINQTVIRSMNTTITTTLPVLSVLIFGGVTLQDFAFALLIGLLTGAYSSLFVAPELLTVWKNTEPRYAQLKKKYS